MLCFKYLSHKRKATDKVYHDVGRLKKDFKNKKKPIVIITGCVAQAEGDILLEKEKLYRRISCLDLNHTNI